jgi:hypothetical protein
MRNDNAKADVDISVTDELDAADAAVRFITCRASRRQTAGWFSVTQSTKGPICHSRVAIGVHATGVGFISTSTLRISKPKLSDWSLWERGDIRGGIVLETTSLCLEDPGGATLRSRTHAP